MYNGRDGVVTDDNGLIYMRARYYSPELRRFVNADIIAGKITNAITLNRYAYANGNPVSFVDPRGLSADNKDTTWGDMNIFERTAQGVTDLVGGLWETVVSWGNAIKDRAIYVWEYVTNDDEQVVLDAEYFAFYKGKLVVRTNGERSGSFEILFITRETNNRMNPEDIIRHEYGHTKQLDQLGIVHYALFIGLPSWLEWSSDSYYDRPWEVTADTYGGVQSRNPTQAKIDAGEQYLDLIKSDIPVWEKIPKLSQYYN